MPEASQAAASSIVGRWLLSSPLYRLTLAGGTPEDLRQRPHDLWHGDPVLGEELLTGPSPLAAVLDEHPEWVARVDPLWRAWAHGFLWLHDLRARGGDEARRRARELTTRWLERHASWDALAWRPDVVGMRIAAWLGTWEFFAASADDAFRARILAAMAREARHLARTAGGAADGAMRIAALHGLIFAGLALPGGDRRVLQGLKLLEREVAQQVLPDGGHVERSPLVHLDVLRRLIEVRIALRAAGRYSPDWLDHAVTSLGAMLRFLRHGDGGLALFNGSVELGSEIIDPVLSLADGKGRPAPSAPHLGFERMAAGRTLLLVDAAQPPPPGADLHAHAGTLSFEMSVGRERLVVNCGAAAGDNELERRAYRGTAAHSTLVLDDTNSSEVIPGGGLGRQPGEVSCTRRENGGDVWLDLTHDGYRDLFGAVHRRRLFLGHAGDDLRGEDLVEGGSGNRFELRFHLHPKVQASLIQDGAAVLMRLPGGGGWRFRARGGRLGLSESAYVGERGHPKRSEQIVVEGTVDEGGARVQWAFQAVKK